MNAEGGAEPDAEHKPRDIEQRTLAYAVRSVRLFRALQQNTDRAGWIVGKQFLRAATSIGANVAEARSGETRKDFTHKLQIAQKEARECLYWLTLLEQAGLVQAEKLAPLLQETEEIIAVLTAIILKAKRGSGA